MCILFPFAQVSIDPPDAEVSETYVPKDGDPPGPAQAAFNGLIPGRAYNISVETVSENQVRGLLCKNVPCAFA